MVLEGRLANRIRAVVDEEPDFDGELHKWKSK